MNYRLSPSDLTFSYEGCKRCFYVKTVNNIAQPSIPLPAIFSQIASLLKNHYADKRTSEVHAVLPPGTVIYGERNVRSEVIQSPNHGATCFIKGRFDLVVSFDDGTYGIIDFKTGNPNSESASLYGRQLHAYAFALEHAAAGELALSPVSKMGLLYFYPSSISQDSTAWLYYAAEVTWIEIEKDERGFLDFIDQVLHILESPEPPEHSPNCQWCNYINKTQKI